MGAQEIGRRTFLQSSGLAALTVGIARSVSGMQFAVPNSSGMEAPKLSAPALACDCHHHIYDAHFPFSQPGAQIVPNATAADYRLLQRRVGTTRNVVVTPSPYPSSLADNRVTLDAVQQFGASARGVAVISPAITDAELRMLADGGIRGIRFALGQVENPGPALADIELLSERVNGLGWHVQINLTGGDIVAAEDLLKRLPSIIVVDHMGQLPLAESVNHPAFGIIRGLIDRGRTWVKLYVGSTTRREEGQHMYPDVSKIAQAYVQTAPERLVWGSNWPHPNETNKPDDAALFDLLAEWAPNEATRHRILVENPEALYGFSKSA